MSFAIFGLITPLLPCARHISSLRFHPTDFEGSQSRLGLNLVTTIVTRDQFDQSRFLVKFVRFAPCFLLLPSIFLDFSNRIGKLKLLCLHCLKKKKKKKIGKLTDRFSLIACIFSRKCQKSKRPRHPRSK